MTKQYFTFIWLSLFSLFSTPSISAPTVIEEEHPVVILGGGIGALSSAIYLGRAGMAPVVVTGPQVGGAITQSHCVQNWPGEFEIAGVDLADRIKTQAVQNGALLLNESIVAVDFSKRPFVITTKSIFGNQESIRKIKAQSCIIALGAKPKLLGIAGEKKYWSRGVYSCAVCDGALYKDQIVAVVGGGDSALTEAHYLSNLAKEVIVVVRGKLFRSVEKNRAEEILKRPNIRVLFQSEVKEMTGNESQLTHILVENNQSRIQQSLSVNALFLAIGSLPNTELFKGQIELDPQGYIVLKNNQETSIPGVYAIGDVSDPEFKQAISAAGDGSKAALQAQKYLTLYSPKDAVASSKKPSKSQPVIDIQTKEDLKKALSETSGVVFLDFYGDYCGPCRMFSPQYEAWAKEFEGKITFAKVNVEKAQGLCQAYQIRGIPTLIILDSDGKIVRKSTGSYEIAEVGRRLDGAKQNTHIDPALFK